MQSPMSFEDFEAPARANGVRSLAGWAAAIEERFGSRKQEYFDFCEQREKKDNSHNAAIPAARFIHYVDHMNFCNTSHARVLGDMQLRDRVPVIPLGHDEHGSFYRLVPFHYGLGPDRDPSRPPKHSALRPLPTLLSGLNITAAPAAPAHPRRCGRLVCLSDDASGFCFAQLGTLERSDDRGRGADSWQRTDFVAVVRVTPTGAAHGLCIVYGELTRWDEYMDEGPYEGEPHHRVGLPGRISSSFPYACARIDGITKLGDFGTDYSTQLSWVDKVHEPVEIAGTVLDDC